MGNCAPVKRHAMCLMIGLDNSGKTTILYQWAFQRVVATEPTTGFEYEEVRYKDAMFTTWDVGGEDKIRALWRHHYEGLDAVFIMTDSHTQYCSRDLFTFTHDDANVLYTL